VMKKKVKQLLKFREKKGTKSHFDDMADALALAICHIRKTDLPCRV